MTMVMAMAMVIASDADVTMVRTTVVQTMARARPTQVPYSPFADGFRL